MKTWLHDDLAADLAQYIRAPDRMVWQDMQLGPSGSPRPDVYTIQKSYSKPCPTAFEVKVSRSDLRSDTTSGKWQSYLKFAQCVVFAVPDGLCTVAEIPQACGLIVRKQEVWRYVRKPTRQQVTIPFDACMKLLIDGVNRVTEARQIGPRTINSWAEHDGIRKKYGEAVALAARDLFAAQKRADDLNTLCSGEYSAMRERVKARERMLISQQEAELAKWGGLKRDLLTWLELDDSASARTVNDRIRALREACDADQRVQVAETHVKRAREAMERALSALPVSELISLRSAA